MRGKPLKFLIIIAILFVLWAGMFTTDYIKSGSLQRPVFALCFDSADDGGSGRYHGIFYSVMIETHIDAQYGAVVDSAKMECFGQVVSASVQ